MAKSEKISLREITVDTYRSFLELEVTEEQKNFVAPISESITQAYFEENAWFRGIYAGETPIGFTMLYIDEENTRYYLWRFLIDYRFQGKGYGEKAMDLIIDFVKTLPNATELFTSVVESIQGPQSFYEKIGFELTGEYEEDEAIMRYKLK